jgi:predicted kinase
MLGSVSFHIYFLIGCPSSGKSTLANQLIKQTPNYRIISTDQIRQKFFGDESIQGNWQLIETEIFAQIQQQLIAGNSIIYDATNSKRPWRIALLQKLKSIDNLDIIGLHLQTPLEICKQWNKQRQREVPEPIIESYYQALKQFPPIPAEGFTAIYDIAYQNGNHDLTTFTEKITQLSRSKINRQNRTQHRKVELHRYSQLLDFDRLMHLINLILEHPGIGNLQQTDPQLLENILGQKTNFNNSIDEICAIITIKHHSIYADPIAIKQDLEWLEKNGIIGEESHASEIHIETLKNSDIITHSYSDIEPFQRLIKIIRFIIHNPFLYNSEQGSLQTLVSEMEAQHIIDLNSADNVRKDIEKILKPFRILPNFPMKKGYFAGTGILSEPDLIKVFKLLEAQAKSLEDPVSLEIYQRFQERIGYAQLAHPQQYPVRGIYNRSIVDLKTLPSHSLGHHVHQVESAIELGKCLELKVLNNSARFTDEPNDYFLAFPIQIVFHNIGWYLGFEYLGGEKSGLFRFERLDRLCLGREQYQQREHQIQYQALQKLQTLYQNSGGIFLGNNQDDQIAYLSKDKTKKAQVEIQIELWFPDNIFRFITEGNKRFPLSQMTMSPPIQEHPPRNNQSKKLKTLFTLNQTDETIFRNRFQVTLPKWALEDVDLFRWIIGFGDQVKVIHPPELVNKIRKTATQLTHLYHQ